MVRPLHAHDDLIWVTVARWLISPRLRDYLSCRGNNVPQSDQARPRMLDLLVVEAYILVKAPPFLSTRGQVLVDLVSQLIDQFPGGRIPQGFDVPNFDATREHTKLKSGRPIPRPGDECHMGRAVVQRPYPGFDVPICPKHNNLSCWVVQVCRARLAASREGSMTSRVIAFFSDTCFGGPGLFGCATFARLLATPIDTARHFNDGWTPVSR